MNILITGASGFLGSALAKHFSKLECHVSLLVRKNSNLYRYVDISNFRIGRCDSEQEINEFIKEVCPDVVIHTACSYGRNNESIIEMIDSNIRFGAIVLRSLSGFARKICFINIATALDQRTNLYALTKSHFVEYGQYLASSENKDFQFINLIVEYFYGPGQDETSLIGKIFRELFLNKKEILMTLGHQKRDFIFIEDLLSAVLLVIEQRLKFDSFHNLPVGNGAAVSIRELAKLLLEITNTKTKFLFGAIPYRKYETMFSEADLSELKKLGWAPKYSLESGLRICWRDFNRSA